MALNIIGHVKDDCGIGSSSIIAHGSILRLKRLFAMRLLLVTIAVLIFAMPAADARHWRHWYYSRDNYRSEDRSQSENTDTVRPRGNGGPTVASLVPSDWTAEPQTKDWNGKRFVSPDGASWVALYKTPVGDEAIADHMRKLIFAPGEMITYLRGERSWFAVSGFKGSNIFYRKAMLRQVGAAQHQGDLTAWTKEYREAKAAHPALTFSHFTHVKKLALVVATAARMKRG
jgi:hypothetical protein